jgi:integrase
VFGPKRLDSITRAEVAAFHTAKGLESGATANRYLALLSIMFETAILWGVLPPDFQSPTKRIRRFREKPRERVLKVEELARLLTAAADEKDVRFLPFLKLLIFTGARRGELLKLRWQDVDSTGKQLRIRDRKGGEDLYLRPAPGAWKVFDTLRGFRTNEEEYVFPGRWGRGHRKGFRAEWEATRKRARVSNCKIHDIRASVATALIQSGIPTASVQQTLGHAGIATTERYIRLAGGDTETPLQALGNVMVQIEEKVEDEKKKAEAQAKEAPQLEYAGAQEGQENEQ